MNYNQPLRYGTPKPSKLRYVIPVELQATIERLDKMENKTDEQRETKARVRSLHGRRV